VRIDSVAEVAVGPGDAIVSFSNLLAVHEESKRIVRVL
jgi:hypothetical protein